jgi:hypothetical protein
MVSPVSNRMQTSGTPQAFLLLRLRRQELPERSKQCANVSLVFSPVYDLKPVACAFDINSARSAGCDRDLLAPRKHAYLRPGLNLPGFRVRSGDAKPALRYCFYAGLKNFIRSCGKVRAMLIACGHFSSIHVHSVFTPRSAGKMLSRLCLSRHGHVTRNAGSSRPRLWGPITPTPSASGGAPVRVTPVGVVDEPLVKLAHLVVQRASRSVFRRLPVKAGKPCSSASRATHSITAVATPCRRTSASTLDLEVRIFATHELFQQARSDSVRKLISTMAPILPDGQVSVERVSGSRSAQRRTWRLAPSGRAVAGKLP